MVVVIQNQVPFFNSCQDKHNANLTNASHVSSPRCSSTSSMTINDPRRTSRVWRQRFRLLVVDFQVEEVELSVHQSENKKPDINKRWNPNLKNNLNKWEKPMSIEKLHTMLRDHPRLRGKCRSLMVSINDATQMNEIAMILEMIGWMPSLRRLAIDVPPEPRVDARVPTLKLIQKASKSLPNLEAILLYFGLRKGRRPSNFVVRRGGVCAISGVEVA